MEKVSKPLELILFMQTRKHHWWYTEELEALTGFKRQHLWAMLNRMVEQNLVERRLGQFTRKTFWKVNTQ